MRYYALIPVRTGSGPQRARSLRTAVGSLCESMATSAPTLHEGTIHFSYNGRERPIRDPLLEAMIRCIPGARLRVTHHPIASKIGAVNEGLAEARAANAELFLCMDDDVLIPGGAISDMVKLYRRRDGSGAACAKAPLLRARSTPFQALYSYAVCASFRFSIAPKRPSGSFYLLDPSAIAHFPDGCNEGDMLGRRNVPLSALTVLSEYPPSAELEIMRQRRLLLASRQLGYERLHDNEAFLRSLGAMRRLPPAVDRERYRASLQLWGRVREGARS